MRSATQHVYIAIGGDRTFHTGARRPRLVRFAKIPPTWQLRPIAPEPIAIASRADDHIVGHFRLLPHVFDFFLRASASKNRIAMRKPPEAANRIAMMFGIALRR